MFRRTQAGRRVPAGLLLALLCILLPQSAAAQNGAGRVITAQGQVSIERGRELWAIQASDFIQPGQLIVTGSDGYALIQLEDNSRFEVFGDARVIFRANRGNWRDLLDIFLGKVRIHIEKLGGRPNPYRVNSATALIAVRGTVFDVSVDSMEATTIAVEEGLVAVSHKLLPSTKELLLKPGESVVVRPGEPLMAEGINKTRTAVRILSVVLDEALRTIRLGSAGRGGTTAPTGTTGGTGDMGQAPPSPPVVPGDDSGPGAGAPASPSPSPPAPSTKPKP